MLGFLSLSVFSESNQRKTREERARKLSPLLTLYSRQHGSLLLPAPRRFCLNRFCDKPLALLLWWYCEKRLFSGRRRRRPLPYNWLFCCYGDIAKSVCKCRIIYLRYGEPKPSPAEKVAERSEVGWGEQIKQDEIQLACMMISSSVTCGDSFSAGEA